MQHMSETSQPRFVIIDGNAIIHRAYHALPPLTTKDGTMVNAVFGFTSMLLKVLSDLKPTHIAATFDLAGPTFRDELYDKYKATRVKADQDLYDQIPLVYKMVEGFQIPIFTQQGYEADDMIGMIMAKVKGLQPEMKVTIVTGDKDMLQLVDDKQVEVYLLRRGMSDVKLYDEEAVQQEFGFGPKLIPDYKALKGDTSDNIPGVHGIGEKTAKELIQKVGGIEEIYQQLGKKTSELNKMFKESVLKKLREGKADAEMSKILATIVTDLDGFEVVLSVCAVKPCDAAVIKPLFHSFEFFTLLSRVPGIKEATAHTNTETGAKETRKKRLVRVNASSLKETLSALNKQKRFACKELLTGTDVFSGEIRGFVCVTQEAAYYIELKIFSAQEQEAIFDIFRSKKNTVVGHDIKQLVKALIHQHVEVGAHLFDVMVASYVINSSTRAHDLRTLVVRELGKEMKDAVDQSSLFGASPDIAAYELQFVLELYVLYARTLTETKNEKLFEDIEMPLISVLARVELHGVAVDEKKLKELSETAEKTLASLTKKIWKEVGQEFNIASPVQLRDILFDTLGLPTEGIKKGKTGYSTAASELEKLHGAHPVIELLEEHRELSKLQNTYVSVLPTLVNKHTGRIHASFNQAVATTGRLSSSDPNLQNIPIRTQMGREIRTAFVAEQGHTLVAADYSQIELRIVASLAKDKRLIEIFEKGEDVHLATAAVINGVALKDVTSEMRSAAKGINFGVLYGMGAFGLSSRTGITQWQAKEFIDAYFEKFSGVKKWIDSTLEFARENGYVETLFGRRRYIPELSSDNYQLRSAGERMAVNMPVQGTAADMMKLAMIEVDAQIKQDETIKMILQVHDELVFEVNKGQEEKVAAQVREVMAKVVKLGVPVEVHIRTGERWGAVG
ncbi:MAG: DNA polymerase I [Candidatus Magasanikbacteria bacterium RIFCSPHIGHO2_02_FULL_47_14]|uniref:DNA polymerase I n=1 Tax=Candidatus Magasanikbacteria bacterium RIFCSPHIGHO2_02_FULL_47_14 TaxID=1798680 RepID=A0A1F6M4A7_9BACT|nr:MAG: DNA polymerase I [Candidatus Magasanikbacteria bacterium RIFCSPHIGHO2_02_FULL_47_14]